MKLENDEALNLLVELIRAGKVDLPVQTKFNVGNTAPSAEALNAERARVQAKYLRAFLEELTKDDEEAE